MTADAALVPLDGDKALAKKWTTSMVQKSAVGAKNWSTDAVDCNIH